MADIDGDGDLDLVGSISRLRRDIAWRENVDGRGTFGPNQIVSTQTNLVDQIIAADIDGDGDNDIITSGGDDLEIAWYENRNGKGRFGPKQFIDTSERHISSLTAADLDGDGDLDLFQMIEPQRFVWYENTIGRGEFRTRDSYETLHDRFGRERDAIAFDFDFDGDLDILTPGYWMENDGNAIFAAPERFIDGKFLAHVFHIDDFDNNGRLDIFLADSHATFAWYETNAQTGKFEWQRSFDTLSERQGFIYDFDAADIDGDGDLELVVDEWLGADGNPYTWVYDLPSGELLVDYLDFQFFETTHVYDVNGDGTDNLVFSGSWYSFDSGELRLFNNVSVENWHTIDQIELNDLDGDGDLDILSSGRGGNNCQEPPCAYFVTWKENVDGRGTYGPRQLIDNGRNATLIDVDSDGTNEIFTGETVYSYSDGEFVPAGKIDGVGAPRIPIDWDRDGDVDLLSVFNGDLFLHENDLASSRFLPRVRLINGDFDGEHDIAANDIDDDGDWDIVAVLTSRGEVNPIVWYEKLDDGTFAKPQTFVETSFSGVDAIRMLPRDFDNDGDTDWLFIFSRTAVVMVRNDDGRFDHVERIDVPPNRGPVAVDLDGDGNVDLVPIEPYHGTERWFENVDGSFDSVHRIAIDGMAAFGDIDGDGDIDYVTGQAELTWYENRPLGDSNDDGKFNSADFVVVMQAAKYEDDVPNNASFEEGDWNGDGDFDSADLVAAMQAGNYTPEARTKPDLVAAVFAGLDTMHVGTDRRTAFVA
jgi:hypothetical protein